MKYRVNETYASATHKTSKNAEFVSESKDLFELAVQARLACYPPESQTHEMRENVRGQLEFDDVRGQLEDQDATCFTFLIWSSGGEWEITVESDSE